MDRLKPCPYCGVELSGTKDLFTNGTSWRCPNGCIEKMKQPMPDEEFYQCWNTRPIENALRASLDEWKADAERLAELVEAQRNAYDMMGCDGVTGITDEGYKKLERALIAHTALVEKEKNNE